MKTYNSTIVFVNEHNNAQHHVFNDIEARNMFDASQIAISVFLEQHDSYEIKKLVVDLQHPAWSANMPIYRGN